MSFSETMIGVMTSQAGIAISSLSSIFSLILTIFVLFSISRLKSFYIFKARVPEVIGKLEVSSSRLSEQLDGFESMSTSIKKILADMEVHLKTLRGKVNGDLGRQVKILIEDIDNIETSGNRLVYKLKKLFAQEVVSLDKEALKKRLETLHLNIYKLIASCEEKQHDAAWES